MILVTGATGNVGSVVVRELRAAGAEVRLGVRHPAPGTVDEVAFDFTDASTWRGAFDGVRSLFLVRPPAIGNVKRDLLPAIAAARDAGLEHVVFLSLQGAEKNKVVPHATVEAWLRESGMTWTFVRASFFHQNLTTTHVSDVRDRDEILVPAGKGATAFVDAVDVGAVAAAALLEPERHAGRAWTVTGPRALTYGQVADILTAELGRPVRYPRPGVLRYVRHARRGLGMPWGMVAVTTAIYTTARLGLAAGLTDEVRTVLGRAPIDFAEFAHRERDAWIPVPTTTPRPAHQDGSSARPQRLALIGATGRTGRHALAAALDRGHDVTVLVRDPAKLPDAIRDRVRLVVGDSTDPAALSDLVTGADAVVSALGPTGKQPGLHTRTARALVQVMQTSGPRRFVGVSGAGIDVPGDRKAGKDKAISWLIRTLGGDAVKDKPAEYSVWAGSGLSWTLVRPPRLVDGPATGHLEHDAHHSTRSTSITRDDLGTFLVDVVERDQYVQSAPFVATARR